MLSKGYKKIDREGVVMEFKNGEVCVYNGPYGIAMLDPDSWREIGEWLIEKSRNPQGCSMCYGSGKVERRTFDHRGTALVPCPSCAEDER